MGKILIPETVLAYTAGIIDGEGWIGICKTYAKGRKTLGKIYPHRMFQISVSNSIESMIDYLHINFGGVKTFGHRPNRKPYYRWTITSRSAEDFLRMIYPYLVAKRDQAEISFRFRETFRKRNQWSRTVPPEDLAVREECYKSLRDLKRAA